MKSEDVELSADDEEEEPWENLCMSAERGSKRIFF